MLIIGHRGAKGLAPENTLESFKAALKHAVDSIEFDVQVTSDAVVILNHDSEIRSNEMTLKIAGTPYKELKHAKPDLLTLQEALDYLAPRVPVIIEIKPVQDLQPIFDVITAAKNKGLTTSQLSISSFDYPTLITVKQTLPHVRIIVNEKWSGVRASYRARKLNTKFITMNQKWLWRGFIRSVASRGYKLSAYPLNDIKKARRFKHAGLYACITDYPDRYR